MSKIAIIGLSCYLPEVTNYSELVSSIKKGESLIKDLPDNRKEDIQNRFGPIEFAKSGYLSNIDQFDNAYFGIVPPEATRMDPEQRLMLEYIVKALYNAGYNRKDIKQMEAGIFYTHESSSYDRFFDSGSNLSLSAHTPGMSATRVANFLDIRGPVVGYHTTCSTALTALHYACQSIRLGECDIAFAAGVKLNVTLKEFVEHIPILSNTEGCRPFDDNADGTVVGEGVVCLVLKKLEDAIEDNDQIYATIAGSAVNHGGQRLANITAPNDTAQTEVILKSWKNAKVDPKNIGFIEAHGTGTILGDPVEYTGIVNAFKDNDVSNHTCSISSVKGQLGHLDTCAGFVGMLRVIVALGEKILPKQVGFEQMNNFIQVDDRVKVQSKLETWQAPENGLRAAGISSFGLTGTNIHMVMEEFVEEPVDSKSQHLVFSLAAETKDELKSTSDFLVDYISENHKVDLFNFCNYISRTYSSGKFRKAFEFTTRLNLMSLLKDDSNIVAVPVKRTLYFIVSKVSMFSEEGLHEFLNVAPRVKAILESILKESGLGLAEVKEKELNALFLLALINYIKETSTCPVNLIFTGEGRIIESLYKRNLSLKDFLSENYQLEQKNFNVQKANDFIGSLSEEKGDHLLVVQDAEGVFASILAESDLAYTKLFNETQQLFALQTMLFLNGHALQKTNKRLMAPGNLTLPVMNKKRFWPKYEQLNVSANGTPATTGSVKNLSEEDIDALLETTWKENIGIEGAIAKDDDFFDLGGNSLIGLDVLSEIENEIGITLDYQDIFDYPTIVTLSKHIKKLLQQATPEAVETKPVHSVTQEEIALKDQEYGDLLTKIDQLESIEQLKFTNALITGATGFLGVFLVKRLLDLTEVSLTCLIRGEDQDNAHDRFWNKFKHYFPDTAYLDQIRDRVRVVKGDITMEGLGIDPEIENSLKAIDTVYHSAALVAHFGQYQLSEKINFEGTKNVHNWALKNNVKCFNHFSTIAVCGENISNVAEINFSELDLNLNQDFGTHIYSKSKHKAEKYIVDQKTDAMEYNVFRLGNVGGDLNTGTFQTNLEQNNIYLALKTITELRLFPSDFLEMPIEISPVDKLVDDIIKLSFSSNELFQTYQLFDDQGYSYRDIIELMNSKGIGIQVLPSAEFRKKIASMEKGQYVNFAAVGLSRSNELEDPAQRNTRYHFKDDATKKYMEKLGVDLYYDRPKYLDVIIEYCVKQGFFTVQS